MSLIQTISRYRSRIGKTSFSGRTVQRTQSLRWVLIALSIGALAGVGAILFDLTINLVSVLALHDIADTRPPIPSGEGEAEIRSFVSSVGHPWLLPIVVAAGGLLSGLLVQKLARETAGGGNDSVISAYHYEGGQIRSRVPFVKLIASAITIGTGGSAGREGPAAQISAGFGSLFARVLNLSAGERRMCVLIGMGAGIGAIFRAPLGGAVLASELLYRDDIEADALIPSLVASIASYSIFGTYAGWEPLFGAQSHVVFDHPAQLMNFAAIGVIAGLVGLMYVRTYAYAERYFERLPIALPLRGAIAGFCVGIIGILVPQTLETGYGWVQIAIDDGLADIALWIVLLLPLLKIVSTSLTVGSGVSGGVFGPGVFIGAMIGVGYWRAFHNVLPGMPDAPASLTIIAMIAHLGAVAHVPLAAMLMVAEMTRNLSLLAPAMIAIGIANLVVGSETLFRSQLPSKADSPVHRHRYAFPLLSTLIAGEAMQTPALTLRAGRTVEEAEDLLHDATLTGAPVVGEDNELLGILTASDIASVPEEDRHRTHVIDLMTSPRTRFDRTASLDTIFDSMATENLGWIPILEPIDRVRYRLIGIVTLQSVLSAYRLALRRKVRRTDAMMVGSLLLEVQVTPESPLCVMPVRDLQLPEEALLVSYTRGEVVRFPHGNTVFEPGDRVGVVTSMAAEERVRRYFEEELSVERM